MKNYCVIVQLQKIELLWYFDKYVEQRLVQPDV